ncbi:MAG: excinuclease ABC subunit UvrC [Luteitalea sp.]|nr:excinuclease ABC subunit UvrC [Luteitalea sp.]
MAIENLKARIARLPEQPGVYLYTNAAAETIYVGKARSLRDRVRSYLGARGSDPKTDALLDEITGVEVILTDSVVEALALENHLIKQRTPKFNILLRDDKNYPYLRLTVQESCPRIMVARRVERDGAFYAGPYLPASLARRTIDLTHKLFGIRSCNEIITGKRARPCLEYDIKRCTAPCVETICSPDQYARSVAAARLFLEGRNDELIAQLRGRMLEAAESEAFERAAQLRDALRTVETLRDRQQKMVTPRLGDRDACGIKLGAAGAVLQIFRMRNGRVIDRVELVNDADQLGGASEAEVVQAGLQQFYAVQPAPPEVHVPVSLEDAEPLGELWGRQTGRRVEVVMPRRGEKRALIDLAQRNAALAYDTRFNQEGATNYEALDALQSVLGLSVLPRRIECFDISTIQGAETVASLVVCEDGRMKRGEYRKFRIKGLNRESGIRNRESGQVSPDDFAAMHEVVHRHFRRVHERGGPWPDLVVVDGGKGQVNAAYAALEELGLGQLVAIGLAKQEELVFTRDQRDAIALAAGSQALRLLQRVRDEAHRFAVTFHRHARRMRDLRSALDAIPGIGPRRRKLLLTRFGSLAGVRRATREELTALVGPKVADAVLRHFAGQ